MLPTAGPNGTQLTGINRSGSAVTYDAGDRSRVWSTPIFPAAAGSYTATYAVRRAPWRSRRSASTPVPRSPTRRASLRWTTTNVATSEISLGTSATKLTTTKVKREATRKHAVSVAGLEARHPYFYRVTSTRRKGVAGRSRRPAVHRPPS